MAWFDKGPNKRFADTLMLPGITAALLTLVPAAEPAKVAMVLAVGGRVTVAAKAGGKRPPKLIDLLAPGDTVATGADGTITLVFLVDKHRERLKAHVAVTVTAEGCRPADAVERSEAVIARSAVSFENVPRLSGAGKGAVITLRDPGLPANPPRVVPAFGTTILTDRPTFSWPKKQGAAAYTVRLVAGRLDTNPGRGKALWSATTRETTLPYPEKAKSLQFGRVYCWFVKVKNGQGVEESVCEAQFSVTTKGELAQLEKLKPLSEGNDPSDLLLAALTFQEHGVYEEALKLFEKLAALRPDEGLFQGALADYYQRAGRVEESDRALKRAKELKFELPGGR